MSNSDVLKDNVQLIRRVHRLERQRNELVVALKNARLYVEHMAEAAAEDGQDLRTTALMANDLRIVTEAIAKAEGAT